MKNMSRPYAFNKRKHIPTHLCLQADRHPCPRYHLLAPPHQLACIKEVVNRVIEVKDLAKKLAVPLEEDAGPDKLIRDSRIVGSTAFAGLYIYEYVGETFSI
jgi:hypothetical protein